MRRKPSSWTTLLAQLGFRKVKRRKSSWGRTSRLESLELRQMLAAVSGATTTAPIADSQATLATAPENFSVGHFTLISGDWSGKANGGEILASDRSLGLDSGAAGNDPSGFDPGESWSFRFETSGRLMGVHFDEFNIDDADRALLLIGGTPVSIDAGRVIDGYWRPEKLLEFAAGETLSLIALPPTLKDLERAQEAREKSEQAFELPVGLLQTSPPRSVWKVAGLNVIGEDDGTPGGFIGFAARGAVASTSSASTATSAVEEDPDGGGSFSSLVVNDVAITSFTVQSNDAGRFNIAYSVTGQPADFSIKVFRSLDGVTPDGPAIMSSVVIEEPQTGSVSLEVDIGSDVKRDDYLIAVVEFVPGAPSDDNAANNKLVFGSGAFRDDHTGVVYYLASNTSTEDWIRIDVTAGANPTYRILKDSGGGYAPIYQGAAFNEVHVRTYGGNDRIEVVDPLLNVTVWGFGGAGNDNISLGAGGDYVDGGVNVDTIYGYRGEDEVHGGSGIQSTSGVYGGDLLFGGDHNDRIYGDQGPDWLVGGAGNDVLYGGDELNGYGGYYSGYGDMLYGDEGDDVLFGGAGDDRGYGGTGNDILYGDNGNDSLWGESGNDILLQGTGAGTLNWITGQSGVHDPLVINAIGDENESLGTTAFGIGDLSLREALAVAAAQDGSDAISFDPVQFNQNNQPITIALSAQHGELSVGSGVLTITGPGARHLTIDAQGGSRVMSISSGATAEVKGLTIAGGRIPVPAGSQDTTTGGGIFVNGGLTLDTVALKNNFAAFGAAVYVAGAASATLVMRNSTVSHNTTLNSESGAIHSANSAGSQTFTNVTISGNTGSGYQKGGSSGGLVSFVNATVTDNTGRGLGSVFGTGPRLHNTIVVGNDGFDLYRIFDSTSSYNLIGTQEIGLTDNVNYNDVGVVFGQLAMDALGDYGGPTWTHALGPHSIAIDRGSNANIPGVAFDQRGVGHVRIYDDPSEPDIVDATTRVDVGAFEYFGQFQWREAERTTTLTHPAGSVPKLEVVGDLTASGSRLLSVFQAGNPSVISDPTSATASIARYDFTVEKTGDFRLWLRVVAPNADANLLWWRFNGGAWAQWSPTLPASWQWAIVASGLNLSSGTTHSLEIASGEDGLQIDKFLLTDNVNPYSASNEVFGSHDPQVRPLQIIDLPILVRDFHKSDWTPPQGATTQGHPDFQYLASGANATTGLVQNALELGNPAFASSQSQLSNPTNFRQWFYNAPTYNRAALVTSRLIEDSTRQGVFQFVGSYGAAGNTSMVATTHEFFPLDNALYGANGTVNSEAQTTDDDVSVADREADEISEFHNYGFTAELRAEFTYDSIANQYVNVLRANDDLWIFVDGRLFIDLGGRHANVGQQKSLNNFGLVHGKKYSFDVFYANRSTDDSHLVWETNLNLTPVTRMVEDDRLLTEQVATFDAPATPQAVQINYRNLMFDSSSSAAEINDAFELALLDSRGNSVVPTIATGRDAFFNWTEGRSPLLSRGVTHDSIGGTITVDISALPAGSVSSSLDDIRLVARLVNNDDDTRSTVTVRPGVNFVAIPTPSAAPSRLNVERSVLVGGRIDVSDLDDVTSYFDIDYTHTMFDDNAQELRAGIKLTNTSSATLRGPLIAVISNLRPRTAGASDIAALETDGIAPSGARYYDLTQQAFSPIDLLLAPGETVEGKELVFRLPSEKQFDYDLKILGHSNEAPFFTSLPFLADPVNGIAKVPLGNTFTYDANGDDPEQDDIHFSLITKPAGLAFTNPLPGSGGLASGDGKITWTPTSGQLNVDHPVRLRVIDQFGASRDQEFKIRVVTGTPNQAPYFTDPLPIVDAYVGKPYIFDAKAFDPDFDKPLYFELGALQLDGQPLPSIPGQNGDSFSIDANGQVTWTPTDAQVGKTLSVELKVHDRANAGDPRRTGVLTYNIAVHQGNRDPYFTSVPFQDYDPASNDDVAFPIHPPRVPVESSYPVSPAVINTSLARGQIENRVISIDVPVTAPKADIVFAIDISSSMGEALDWLEDTVVSIENQLKSLGLGLDEAGGHGNKYSLVTWHQNTPPGAYTTIVPLASGTSFGSAADVAAAASTVIIGGAREDGYTAINFCLDLLATEGRDEAVPVVVLITDEDPDDYSPSGFADIKTRLLGGPGSADDVVLMTITDTTFAANDGDDNTTGVYVQAGDWSTTPEGYEAAPQTNAPTTDALAVLNQTPQTTWSTVGTGFYGLRSRFTILDAGPGYSRNASFIFDYQSPHDFKFIQALENGADDMWIWGHRNASGWVTDKVVDANDSFTLGQTYEVEIGLANFSDDIADLYFGGPYWQQGSISVGAHDYGSNVNDGRIGVGTDNSAAVFESLSLWQPALFGPHGPSTGPFVGYEFGQPGRRSAMGVSASHAYFMAEGGSYSANPTTSHVVGHVDNYEGNNRLTVPGYVQLTLESGGATWDLHQLNRIAANADLAESFAHGFGDVLGHEILDRVSVQLTSTSPVVSAIQPDPTLLGRFNIQLTGDGNTHGFLLQFKNNDQQLLGTIPVSVNGPYLYSLSASDPDDDQPLTFQWAVGGQPVGASLSGDVVRYDPPEGLDMSQPVHFKVEVSDGVGGRATQEWYLDITPLGAGNLSPVVAPLNLTIEVGDSISERVIASDSDAYDDRLQYFLTNGVDVAPAGLIIDQFTGQITWSPRTTHVTGVQSGSAAAGLADGYDLKVRVIDGLTGITDAALKIYVLPEFFGNSDPVFDERPPMIVDLTPHELYSFTATAIDADHDQLTYDWIGPAGMAVQTINNAGVIRWNPEGVVGNFPVLLIVRDGKDGRDFYHFTFDVAPLNEAPVFVTASLGHAQAGKSYQGDINAVDPEGTAVTYWPGLNFPSSWLSIDGATGLITSTAPAPTQATVTFDVIAKDAQLQSRTKAYTLVIDNPPAVNRAPSIDSAPRSHIAVGQELIYRVDVSDPDNNVITIATPNLSGPAGLDPPVWDAQSRVFRWTANPANVRPGDVVFINVAIQDNGGLFDTESFPVVITDRFVNQPPQITDELFPAAIVGQEYRIQFHAVDPDGDTVFWSAEQSPDPALVLDPVTGGVFWKPQEKHLGEQTIRVRARDTYGAYREAEFTILVRGVTPPTVISNPPSFIPPFAQANINVKTGEGLRVDLFAADPDGGRLYFELEGALPGMHIVRVGDTSARVMWDAPSNVTSTSFNVTARVYDQLGTPGTNTQSFAIHVIGDDAPPTIGLSGPTKAVVGTDVLFLLSPEDNVGLSDVRLTARLGVGAPFAIPVKGDLSAIRAFTSLGVYTVEAVAVDTAGNASAPASMQIEIVAQATLPAANIITTLPPGPLAGSTPIQFSVNNFNANVNYRLELIDVNSHDVIARLASGVGVVATGSSSPIVPTSLPNGVYTLRLTAENEFRIPVVDEETVRIDTGRLKVGNFAISFVDLQIPVSGIPITVRRSYDSLRAGEKGEFGFGWSLDLNNTELAIDYGAYDSGEDAPFVSAILEDGQLNPNGGTRVVVTLPDGTTEGFTFVAKVGNTALGSYGGPAVDFRPSFTADPGVTSELVVADQTLISTQTNNGTFTVGETFYNPLAFGTAFTLKTRNGLEYTIVAETGNLYAVTDRNSNTLYFREDGIESSAGRKITFEKDHLDRIAAIIDSAGLRIEYGYDPVSGDLVSVTNREQETTTLQYEDATRPHFLTGIVNHQGVKVLAPEFDPVTGRLIRLGDASGESAEFDYPPISLANGNIIERVKDANDVPTELVRDADGNVIRRIQRIDDGGTPAVGADSDDAFIVTIYEYDANYPDKQTRASRPFLFDASQMPASQRYTHTPTDIVWLSTNEYDPVTGDLLITKDALGNSSFSTYNSFGQPETITDANWNTTVFGYDPDTGNRTSTIVMGRDKDGRTIEVSRTSFDYDPRGNLKQVFDTDGRVISSFEYNSYGDLISTTDANGVTRYYEPNAYGEIESTYLEWIDPWSASGEFGDDGILLPSTTVINRTEVDDEGRVTLVIDPNGNRTETIYDAAGRVQEVIVKTRVGGTLETPVFDQFDDITKNFYDIRSNLVERRIRSKDDAGNEVWIVTRTAYDKNGRPEYTVDPHVEVSPDTLQLSAPGTQTVYDDLGRVIETKSFDSVTITITNLPPIQGQNTGLKVVQSVTHGASASSHRMYYDAAGRVAITVDALGLITEFEYDDAGRQEAITQYLSGTYDLSGVFDPSNTAWKNSIPASDTLRTTFHYDDFGRRDVVTDPNGHSTRTAYDELGRAVETTFHDGTVAETVYDKLGRRIGEVAQYNPVNLNGLSESQTAEFFASITTNYEYDVSGHLTAVVLPPVTYSGSTGSYVGQAVRPRYEYDYDAFGNQVVIRDNIIQLTNGVVVTNHDGVAGDDFRETTFAYDHLERQIARTLPLGQSLTGENRPFRERMSYDAAGRPLRSVDFEGRTTEYVYDDLGRLDKKLHFAAGGSSPNEIVDYVYDGLGRQTKVIQDFDGNLATLADQRVTDNAFDSFGRLKQTASAEGVVNYRYNQATGLLDQTFTSVTAAAGELNQAVHATRYEYDRLGRMNAAKATWRNGVDIVDEVTEYRYDKSGNLDKVLSPISGSVRVVTDYDYDPLNRLKKDISFKDLNGDAAYNSGTELLLTEFTYTIRADGKRTSAVEKQWTGVGSTYVDQTFTWTYDNVGRLNGETYDLGNNGSSSGDYRAAYKFDLVGNRLQKIVDDLNDSSINKTSVYQYDKNDRLVVESLYNGATTTGTPAEQLLYDYGVNTVGSVAGNATQQTGKRTLNGSGTLLSETRNSYNVQGRLSQVGIDADGGAFAPTQTLSFGYNDQGVRVHKIEGTEKTLYLVDGQNPTGYAQVLQEVTRHVVNQTFIRAMAYTLGLDVISQASYPATPSGGTSHYLLYDGHGSTRALVDAAGAVINSTVRQIFAYDAYGNMLTTGGLASSAQAITSLLYSGEQTDKATGLQYLRARYYDPRIGRFNRLDPFAGNIEDPLSLHKYLYASGDPVQFVDPSGLETAGSLSVSMSMGAYVGSLNTPAIISVLQYTAGTLFVGAGAILFHEALPYLKDVLNTGVDRVQELIGTLMANAATVAEAIETAVTAAAAVAVGTLFPNPPLFPIVKSLTPMIYDFDVMALGLNPSWYLMQYNGPYNQLTNTNRSWVKSTYRHKRVGAPLGYQLDEFPYASTIRGGPFGPALAEMVPGVENGRQGAYLSLFYQFALRGAPLPFVVVPIPI